MTNREEFRRLLGSYDKETELYVRQELAFVAIGQLPNVLDELDAKDARIKELEDELAYYKKQPEERVFLISPSLEKKINKELDKNRAALEGDDR